MNNIISKSGMTTAATVVLLCCLFILGQTVPVQSVQIHTGDALIELDLPTKELSGGPGSAAAGGLLKGLAGTAKVVLKGGTISGLLKTLNVLVKELPKLNKELGPALSKLPSLADGLPPIPNLVPTDVNIGVQCARCGDSPIWQVINDTVLTGGTFGKDNVFQIGNTGLPDTFKLKYCPTGANSCRDLVFSPDYLVVDNGNLPDSFPLYFLNKLGN